MSRKHDRKKMVIDLASRVLAQTTSDPNWIARNYIKPKPKWIPGRAWVWIVKKVVRFPLIVL